MFDDFWFNSIDSLSFSQLVYHLLYFDPKSNYFETIFAKSETKQLKNYFGFSSFLDIIGIKYLIDIINDHSYF